MTKISLSSVSIPKLFNKYSITIFVVFNALLLILAVLLLQQVIYSATSTNGESASDQLYNIDTSVTKKINSLYSSSEVVTAPAVPSGRINPFAEK